MKRSWARRDMLPKGAGLTLRGVSATEDGLLVEAEACQLARCPACGQPSSARHSRYWRTLKDVPAHGCGVTLRVRVSRWRCRTARCQTAIFAERLPGVAAPCVLHTTRFGMLAHLVGHALGGRAGARLLARLRMDVSTDTVLRLVKRRAPASTGDDDVRVLGIDDWAWRKGQHHFGTILVDLERRRVVDVLAVRTADAVAEWLAARPSITVISRGRGQQLRFRIGRMTALVPPVAHFLIRIQDPIHRAHRTQIAFLVQEGGGHLCGGLVHEAFAMQEVEDVPALNVAQGPMRWTRCRPRGWPGMSAAIE